MTEQFKNFGQTTLASGITDVQTSITVIDGSVFPATGDFRITIEDEILLVTARSTNTLTVTRGAESTTNVAHSSGVQVRHNLTAASIVALVDEHVHASDVTFAADSQYDIGSDTVRPANVYADDFYGYLTGSADLTAGGLILPNPDIPPPIPDDGRVVYDSGGMFAVGDGATAGGRPHRPDDAKADILFAADSTYDIGETDVRPANIYADVVTTGSLTGLGGLSLINASGYANIELDGSSGSYIDFHGPNSTDYGVRLIETDTTSGTAQGDLVFYGNSFRVQGGADLGSNVDANTWQNVYLRYLWKPTLKAWYTGRPTDATLRYFKIASGTIGTVNENSTGSVLLQQTDLNSADYKGRGLLQFNIRHNGTGVDPQVAMSLLGLDEYISTDDVVLVCTNNVTTTDWSLYLRVNDAWECWWFQPLITGNAYQDVDSDPAWNIDTTGVTTLPTGTQYKPVFANIQAYKLNMGTGGDTLQPGSLMLTTPSDTAGFETILYLRRASASGGIVPAGASVGRVQFSAHDGNSQRNVAHVDVLMDGTIGSNDMPTKMVFGTTTDGQSSSTDRWAIRAAGHFEPIADSTYSIGATYPNRAYEVIAWRHIAEGYNTSPEVTMRRYDTGGISSGDTLGDIEFEGKDAGGVFRTTAVIRAVPMETWGNNTSLGTNLRFLTTASGGNSASIRWMMTDAGHFEPWSDSAVNIGSDTDRPANIYADVLDAPVVNSPATNLYMYASFQ